MHNDLACAFVDAADRNFIAVRQYQFAFDRIDARVGRRNADSFAACDAVQIDIGIFVRTGRDGAARECDRRLARQVRVRFLCCLLRTTRQSASSLCMRVGHHRVADECSGTVC